MQVLLLHIMYCYSCRPCSCSSSSTAADRSCWAAGLQGLRAHPALLPPAAASLLKGSHPGVQQAASSLQQAMPEAPSHSGDSTPVVSSHSSTASDALVPLEAAAGSSSARGAAAGPGQLRPVLWGELYVQGWRAGSSGSSSSRWQLPGRRNACAELLSQGLAWPAYMEDMHLAGVGNRQVDRWDASRGLGTGQEPGHWTVLWACMQPHVAQSTASCASVHTSGAYGLHHRLQHTQGAGSGPVQALSLLLLWS
jgi:hypothetical protein